MADAGLPLAQGVLNTATGKVEVPDVWATREQYDVDAETKKRIDEEAIAAQQKLEQAREAQLAVQDQTIPLDKLPDDLLLPNELERRREGGINKPPPPAPQIPVSMRPGMAPVAMAPDPNAPIPPAEPEGITRAQFDDRVAAKRAADIASMEEGIRKRREQENIAFEKRRAQDIAKLDADMAEIGRLSRPENLFVKPSIGARILNAIAAGLGAYGATLSGSGRNYALEMILKQQEEDSKLRMFQLQNKLKQAEIDGKGIAERAKMAKDGDKEDAAARIAQTHWIDSQVGKMQALWPAKAQAAAELRSKLQIESAEKTRDFYAKYGGGSETKTEYGEVRQHSSGKSSSTGAPTEAERNYAIHGRTMLRAMDEMARLKQPSKKALEVVQANEGYMLAAVEESKTFKGAWWTEFLRKLDAAPRSDLTGLSESDQIYVNAMERINNAFLRITSGAAIKNDEFVRQADQLILRADDAPAVRAYKMKEMRAVTDDIMTLSGRAGQMLTDRDARAAEGQGEELPGGARVPPEGQTPEQKRYAKEETPEVWKSLEEEGRRKGLDTGEKPKTAKPVTAKEIGKVIPRLSADDKDGVKEASKIKPGSPKYKDAQKYMRYLIDTYGGQ